MKLIKMVIISVFFSWWGANMFFNLLPDSSLPIIQNYDLYKKWDGLFYQRWAFFAPPPDYDDRLYYVYTNIKDSTDVTVYEVFENIHKKRKIQYPFDDDLSNLDYILHNVSSPIGDLIREGYDMYKFKGNCELVEKGNCFQKYIDSVRDDYNTSPHVVTLVKHAKIIAELRELTNSRLQIILAAKEIPRFKDRHNINMLREEYPFFKSNIFNLKTNKWEEFQN